MNDLSLHRPGTYNLEAAERRSSLDYSRMASRPPTPSFWQRLFPRDPYTRMAIVWSFTQFVIISILEGMVLKKQDDYVNTMATAKFPPDSIIVPNARALIVYQALFICAQAFQLFLTTDAIFSLSVIQMLATTAFNGALFVYSIVQYSQAANILTAADMVILKLSIPGIEIHPTKTLELIIIGLMAVFMIGWVFLTFKLYKIFGWTIYKEMGADVSVMKNLRVYHIYLMLLKLDVFFFFGFDVQFLVLVLINQQQDLNSLIIHAAVAIPLSMILLTLAYYGVRFENRILTGITAVGLIGAITYMFLKLIDIWTTTDSRKYLSSKKSLTFFVCLTIVMSLITLVFAVLNFMRFGKGLKEKLNRRASIAM